MQLQLRNGHEGRRAGLFVLVLLLIIGLLSDVTLLPLVAMLGIMALLAVELWEWRMFKHVDYQRELGHTHLFPDNRTTLSITLRNRKFCPCHLLIARFGSSRHHA